MKKHFAFYFLIVWLVNNSGAQTFSFSPNDTLRYGNPSNVLACTDSIKNNSSTGYYVDVIRILNDTAPNWQTSFCLDVCYPPSVDSARFYLLPNAAQSFILDFYSDTVPDTSTVLMKFKNVSNPANTVYQKFYAITLQGLGVNNLYRETGVTIFPSPVIANSPFDFKISAGNDFSLLIYDALGKQALRLENLMNGDNYLSLNLQPGIYVYNLISNQNLLKTGKIAVAK